MTMHLLLLLACTAGKDDSGTGDDGVLHLRPENNYAYTGTLDIGTFEVQTGADVLVDWSALTTDIQRHAIDAATEVDRLWLIWFRYLDQAQVAEGIECDTLDQADIEAAAYNEQDFPDGTTSAAISELLIPPGNPFLPEEYFIYEEGVWLFRLTTGENLTRMTGILTPSASSSNHDAAVVNDTSVLTFDADLSSLTALSARAGVDYLVEWEDAESVDNGCAERKDLELADQLWLARYDGLTVADLEAQILDLELIYADLYTAPAYGLEDVQLSTATNAAGDAFPGFAEGELWLLALRCTTCANPAPLYMTVVNGVAG